MLPIWKHGKREAVVRLARWSGLIRAMELLPTRACLIVLCYHRIGYAEQSLYDRGVITVTPERFDAQMAYLKAHFHVARLDEVLCILDQPQTLRQAHVLITFDDGYRDNYQVAFPILKSHGLQGTFFLTTSFIGTDFIPWWDQIAFLMRGCSRPQIELHYPRPVRVELSPATMDQNIRLVLSLYKSRQTTDTARFLAELEHACGSSLRREAESRQFMDWAEAAEMLRGGMAVGSHTHTHGLLGKLKPEEQLDELRTSQQSLQRHLSIAGDVLALPVGSHPTVSPADLGYRAVFSSARGVNMAGDLQRFDLQRLSVDSDMTLSMFRFQAALAATTGKSFGRIGARK